MKFDNSHVMILFFFVGGLHILEKEAIIEKKNLR